MIPASGNNGRPLHAEVPPVVVDSLGARLRLTRAIAAQTLNSRAVPLALTGYVWFLRALVGFGQSLDRALYADALSRPLDRPIAILGNPRSGTTFLHRFLAESGVAAGSQLFRAALPSVALQKVVRPVLPILEAVGPARLHRTPAHETSLAEEETDDAGVLLHFWDGFFLYAFFLAWADEDLRDHIDPALRGTIERDLAWMDHTLRVSAYAQGADRVLLKSFLLTADPGALLRQFPTARLLYLVRDPLRTVPSGLSLVTGVLDRVFGVRSLPEPVRLRHAQRLYSGFCELYRRFWTAWTEGALDRSRVLVVRYDRLMGEFDGVAREILDFAEIEPSPAILARIAAQAEAQKRYSSRHSYDLSSYGLDEATLRRDLAFVYDTFLPEPGSLRT